MIISIVNKKGGVGKTTIATNLACYFAQTRKTVLIDADEQKSAMSFQEMRPDTAKQFQVVSITTRTILREAQKFEADIIIIDVPAKDTPVSRAAMAAADRIIVPVQPSQYDLLATEETFDILDQLSAQKENFKIAAVQNLVLTNPNIKISGEVSNVLKEMASDYNFTILESKLHNRLAYKSSAETGLAVFEINGSKFSKSEDEFTKFCKEVEEWL
jgi:chromosome partitioning protein